MVADPAIAPEVMTKYRRSAQARQMAQQQEADQRRRVAWEVARQAARLLRETFGATRVVAFGSLVHGAWFNPDSDIDLAVEGVPAEAFWRAWAAVDRVNASFAIDLVAIEAASATFRTEFLNQGVAL